MSSGEAFSGGALPQLDSAVPAAVPASHFGPSGLSAAAVAATNLRIAERETGGQFTLRQNYPNPFQYETTVPFTLTNVSDVRLDLFDPMGRKVAVIIRKAMAPGEQCIKLNLYGLGLVAGDYAYQLQVSNLRGVYRQRRMMRAL